MEEKIVKIINTEQELTDFRILVRENRDEFPPNKFTFEGKEAFVGLDGQVYWLNKFPKGSLIEDYYHPNHFFIRKNHMGMRVVDIIDVTVPRGAFHNSDSDTWIYLTEGTSTGQYCETADKRRYKEEALTVHIKRYEYEGRSPSKILCTEEYLINLGFVKGTINSDYWFHKNEIKNLDKPLPYKKFDNTYHKQDLNRLREYLKSDGYSEDDIKEKINQAFKDNLKFGVDSLTYSSFEGIEYTFGIEIETCIGRIPDDEIADLNVKAVHDGSLRDENGNTPGGEYVTGVLKGDSGLTQLHELCRILSNRCEVNKLCGVHVHCGTLDWSKEDVIYSYLLGELIEEELFSMLPTSRRSNSYCRKLTRIVSGYIQALQSAKTKSEYNIVINEIYNEIYKEVTYIKGNNKIRIADTVDEDGKKVEASILSRHINKSVNHPLGSKCGYDKNAQRYSWLNFVTLLYLTKGKEGTHTLEFRNHSATMNYTKIKNWIKICFAFCKFVEIAKGKINTGQVTLRDVITTVYPKTGEDLMKYIEERKQVFKSNSESIDYKESTVAEKKTIKEVVCA